MARGPLEPHLFGIGLLLELLAERVCAAAPPIPFPTIVKAPVNSLFHLKYPDILRSPLISIRSHLHDNDPHDSPDPDGDGAGEPSTNLTAGLKTKTGH